MGIGMLTSSFSNISFGKAFTLVVDHCLKKVRHGLIHILYKYIPLLYSCCTIISIII